MLFEIYFLSIYHVLSWRRQPCPLHNMFYRFVISSNHCYPCFLSLLHSMFSPYFSYILWNLASKPFLYYLTADPHSFDILFEPRPPSLSSFIWIVASIPFEVFLLVTSKNGRSSASPKTQRNLFFFNTFQHSLWLHLTLIYGLEVKPFSLKLYFLKHIEVTVWENVSIYF